MYLVYIVSCCCSSCSLSYLKKPVKFLFSSPKILFYAIFLSICVIRLFNTAATEILGFHSIFFVRLKKIWNLYNCHKKQKKSTYETLDGNHFYDIYEDEHMPQFETKANFYMEFPIYISSIWRISKGNIYIHRYMYYKYCNELCNRGLEEWILQIFLKGRNSLAPVMPSKLSLFF